MSYYQIKVTNNEGIIYYPKYSHLDYGRDIGEPGRFTCELTGANKEERSAFDTGYTIEIYRDDVSEFKGVIDNRKHRGKTMVLEGIDFNSVKLTGKQVINRKFISWTNTEILVGKRDVDLVAFSASAKVALISDSASDVQQATVYGVIGDAEPKCEKIHLNGVTEVLTTNTFTELWFVELDAVAVGSVLVKQGTGGTTRAAITAGGKIAAMIDGDGHYGNGLLYDTGVAAGVITAYSGGAITVEFTGVTSLNAIQSLCESCIDATSLNPMEWSCDYSAGNKINVLTSLGTDKSLTVILNNGNECKITDRFENTSNIVNYQTIESRVDGAQQTIRVSSKNAASIVTYGKRSLSRMPVFHNITDMVILQNIADRIIDECKDAVQEVNLDNIGTYINIVLGDLVRVVDSETDFDSTLRIKGIITIVDGINDKFKVELFPSGMGTKMMDRVSNLSDIGKAIANVKDFGTAMEVTRKDVQEMFYTFTGKCSDSEALSRAVDFPDTCLSPGDIVECTLALTRNFTCFDIYDETAASITSGEGSAWTREEYDIGAINGTWQKGERVHTLDECDYLWHHIFVSVCFGSLGGTDVRSYDAVHIRAVLERWTGGAFVDTEFYPDEYTGMSIATGVNQYHAQDFNLSGNLMIPGCWNTHWRSMDASHPARIRLDIKVTDEVEFDTGFLSSYMYTSMKVPCFGISYGVYYVASGAARRLNFRVDSTSASDLILTEELTANQSTSNYDVLSLLNLSGTGWRHHIFDIFGNDAGIFPDVTLQVKLRYYANNT